MSPGTLLVARGLSPVRLHSSRKVGERGVPDTKCLQILGPLRAPAGASSLATGFMLDIELSVSPELENCQCSHRQGTFLFSGGGLFSSVRLP